MGSVVRPGIIRAGLQGESIVIIIRIDESSIGKLQVMNRGVGSRNPLQLRNAPGGLRDL